MASNHHTKDSYSGSPTTEYEKWKIDIENEPEDLETNKWNIYKVPFNLRKLNEKAYTPQLVSIGPIHHGIDDLNPMQKQKLRYLKLCWRHVENKTFYMDKFKKFLEDEEEKIRKSYAENLCNNFNREKFVEMMFLDSVFIMELFLRIQNVERQRDSDDIIVKQSWLNKSIQRDLLLVENQIPLFILEMLYDTVVPRSDPNTRRPTFIELARDYFDCYHTYKKADSCSHQETVASSSSNGQSSKDKPQHFTDLIRSFYICENLIDFENGFPPFKTATKLRESGVSFEKVDNKPLLDIKFQTHQILSSFLCLGCFPKSSYFKACLQIPQLKVVDTTECVLRNLIAFEQCHYPNQPYICNYVSFIDSLIHTKDDVELLVEKEVIVHELGSDKEIATLVNSLCKHVVTDKTCYIRIINDLNKHYQSQWNRTMAALRLVYFRDAWRASSTLVATAVLVFTIFNFCRVVRLVLDLEGGNKQP